MSLPQLHSAFLDEEEKQWEIIPKTLGQEPSSKFEIEGTIIKFGNQHFDTYRVFGKAMSEFHTLAEISGIHVKGVKEFNKAYTEKMGITPSKTVEVLNKLMYKVWMAPFGRDVAWAYARVGTIKRKILSERLKDLIDNLHIVDVCLNDKQKNIIPLCVYLKKTPKELKDSVDRASWKKIIHTSLTKSGLLTNHLRNNRLEFNPSMIDIPSGLLKTEVIKAYNIKCWQYGRDYINLGQEDYTGAKEYYNEVVEVISRLCKENRVISDKFKSHDIASMVGDTYDMAEKLGLKVNPKWGYSRFKEEHDNFAKEITARKYSPEPFTHSWMGKLPKEFEKDGFKATLLISRSEVATEGLVMHHCVAGYSGDCALGTYAVYSVTNPEGIRSTLGLILNKDKASRNQHYRAWNASITDEERQFGYDLINNINGEKDELAKESIRLDV